MRGLSRDLAAPQRDPDSPSPGRRTSPRVPRSGPGPSARLVDRSAAAVVGVPQTAAEGCRAAASCSPDTRRRSTPVTSVARCMTFGRCSTNGDSGRSCSRSTAPAPPRRADGVLVLLEVLARARQGGGQGQVVGVVPGAPDGPGQHPGGDQPDLGTARASPGWRPRGRRQRTSTSGYAPRAAAAPPRSTGCSAPGHQVAGEHDLVRTPAAMAQRPATRDPIQAAHSSRRRTRRPRTGGAGAAAAGGRAARAGRSPRRRGRPSGGVRWGSGSATTALPAPHHGGGTISTLPAEDPPVKAKEPNATGPVPRRSTSSRTLAPAISPQARAASRKRRGPEAAAGGLAAAHQTLAAAHPASGETPGAAAPGAARGPRLQVGRTRRAPGRDRPDGRRVRLRRGHQQQA